MTKYLPGFLRALNRKAALPAFFALSIIAAAPANAQDAAPSPTPSADGQKPTLLDEVVVTATRTDETAAHVSSAYTKLDGDDLLRSQIPDVKDAVNLSPGVLSNVTGVEGGVTGISIRGDRTVDTLLLVDGIKASSTLMAGGAPLLSYASTQNLDDVEIIRGAHSSLFGSDAIGGVVSLQTRRGSGTPETTAFFEGGSYNTFREGFSSGGSLGALDYSFHYAREDTSNDRPNNDLSVNSASLRLDWTANDKLTVGGSVRTQTGAYQEPGSIRLADDGNNDPNAHLDAEATIVSLYAELKATDIWTSKLTLGTYQERYHFDNPFDPASAHSVSDIPYWDSTSNAFVYPGVYPASPEASTDLAVAANWCADWQNTLQLTDSNKLVLGTSLLYETGHDESSYDTAYSSSKTCDYQSATNFGFYAEDQWEVIDNLFLTGGLRYDHYELAGNALTYRGGAAYLLKETHTKFRASYGTAFKEPTFYESYNTELYTGKKLDPERSHSWDAGADQYFFKDQLSLGLTYFHNNTSDLIAYVSPDYNTPYYANRDAMETHGIEASATAKFNDHWQGRLAYTWTESDETASYWTDLSQSSISGMQRMPRVPRHMISADTNYTFDLPVGKLTLGAGVQFVCQTDDVDFSLDRPVILNGESTWVGKEVSMPDYTLLRIYARYDLNERISFTARVENLGDVHYQSTLGYPGLGRAAYGGVQVRF